ncbi:TPA: hypothetical protein ACF77N_005260, partial [Klebsiella pneumoniae]
KTTGLYRFPLIGEISGRVDLFQPYEQSEIGQSEGLGKYRLRDYTLPQFPKNKNKAELNLYLNK